MAEDDAPRRGDPTQLKIVVQGDKSYGAIEAMPRLDSAPVVFVRCSNHSCPS